MLKYLRNRKTMGYLVGIILLVLVIFAFIVLYIPDFMGSGGGVNSTGEVASVEGVPITAQQFVQRYRLQEKIYPSPIRRTIQSWPNETAWIGRNGPSGTHPGSATCCGGGSPGIDRD